MVDSSFHWLIALSSIDVHSCSAPASFISDGIYMYKGSDLPYVTDGLPSYNVIANNIIDTATEGIKIGDTVGNEFTGNVRK